MAIPSTPKADSPSYDGKPPFEYALFLNSLPDPAADKHSIVSTYHSLLSSDPLLTMPVAAIESLILLLSHSPPSTTSETLSLLSHYTSILKSSVTNPTALSAGTDLFQRYLISSLQSPQPTNKPERKGAKAREGDSTDDFQAIRQHLISNGRLFVERAKEARTQIAKIARSFIRDDTVILTYGSSRVVGAVLSAALAAHTYFKLVYICDSSTALTDLPSVIPKASPEFPVAVIPSSAVAHALSQVSLVLLGAEGVVENGGIISGMGTYQLGILAKASNKPVYVCAESHKFVRIFPLSQRDVGGHELEFFDGGKERERKGVEEEETRQVDYTPPELITAIVTESGVHTPSAVSEELIKIWY